MSSVCKTTAQILLILDLIGGMVLAGMLDNGMFVLYGAISGFLIFLLFFTIGEILEKVEKLEEIVEFQKIGQVSNFLDPIPKLDPMPKQTPTSAVLHSWKCNRCGRMISKEPCPYCGSAADDT